MHLVTRHEVTIHADQPGVRDDRGASWSSGAVTSMRTVIAWNLDGPPPRLAFRRFPQAGIIRELSSRFRLRTPRPARLIPAYG